MNIPSALADSEVQSAVDTGFNYDTFSVAGFFDRLREPAPRPLLTMPVAEGHLSSGYGMRRNPVLGTWVLHAGVDYAAPRGTPIVAAGDGVVISAGWENGYGYMTRIQHGDHFETAYAHQSHIEDYIVPGAVVTQGEVIGEVGMTGQATGNHLHYEVALNGETVDPLGTDLQPIQGASVESIVVGEIRHLVGVVQVALRDW